MIDEALDTTTHDMAFSTYDEQLVDGLAQVAQNVKIRLLMIMGELFDNTISGVDYFGHIFNKNGDPAMVDALIKSTIKNTPEVTDIISYTSSIDRASRSMSVSFKFASIYGQAEISNLELMQ